MHVSPAFKFGRGLVGIVAALLAVKVHGRIARSVVIRRGLPRFTSCAAETLVPGPRLKQCVVDRAVRVGEQIPLTACAKEGGLAPSSNAKVRAAPFGRPG
jgi:hypothetical protein